MKKIFVLIMLASTVIHLAPNSGKEGFWVIEKSHSFNSARESILSEGISLLDPGVFKVEVNNKIDNGFYDRKELINFTKASTKSIWRRLKFPATYLNLESGFTLEQFNRFLLLKENIQQTDLLQRHPHEDNGFEPKKLSQNVLLVPPKIDFSFIQLYNETNVRFIGYFEVAGAKIKPKNSAIFKLSPKPTKYKPVKFFTYYFILVDLKTSEVIYREKKFITHLLNKKNLTAQLYKSYEVLHANITF